MTTEPWALILAGGDGCRLQPLTEAIVGGPRPKYYCPLKEAGLDAQPKRRCRADVVTGRTHRVQHAFHSHHEEAVMMRRNLFVALSLLVAIATMAPVADAQAPPAAPVLKTTITGIIDTVASYSRNVSNADGIFNRQDKQWYARNRGRFDIIGEVGPAKAVFGFEIDEAWG